MWTRYHRQTYSSSPPSGTPCAITARLKRKRRACEIGEIVCCPHRPSTVRIRRDKSIPQHRRIQATRPSLLRPSSSGSDAVQRRTDAPINTKIQSAVNPLHPQAPWTSSWRFHHTKLRRGPRPVCRNKIATQTSPSVKHAASARNARLPSGGIGERGSQRISRRHDRAPADENAIRLCRFLTDAPACSASRPIRRTRKR